MPILPLSSPHDSHDDSQPWLFRVTENLGLAFQDAKLQSSSANGAPLHFESVDHSTQNGGAQTFSAGVHIVILTAFFLAIASTPSSSPLHRPIPVSLGKKLLAYVPPRRADSIGPPSLGSDGSGGGRDTQPARFGYLAPGSSMPLVPPRLTHNDQPALPAPPAVFDPDAPVSVATVAHLGLPWMTSDMASAGRGRGHGFGEGDGDTMGDGNGTGAGDGNDHGPYNNAVSPVTCIYCPEPLYTDEARKVKLQGKLVLQVLVGADGRAMRIHVAQGLGMGLDESAVETVRGWRFSPGRDASKHPVPVWVTIETRFQLY